MRHLLRALFTFELGGERNDAVLRALGPETAREIPRATARAWLDGERLHLEIRAESPASLRAAVNSYLRWVRVAAEAAQAGAGRGEAAPAKKGRRGRDSESMEGSVENGRDVA
ncbi:MAG: KEOPS complex subunit Pcc1 [Thermoplasmatota archaeon]